MENEGGGRGGTPKSDPKDDDKKGGGVSILWGLQGAMGSFWDPDLRTLLGDPPPPRWDLGDFGLFWGSLLPPPHDPVGSPSPILAPPSIP